MYGNACTAFEAGVVRTTHGMRYDIGFAAGPVARDASIEAITLISRQWTFVYPPSHALAHMRSIDIEAIAQQPLVSFSPAMWPDCAACIRAQ